MAFSKAEEFEEKDILAARFAKALSHPARIAIVRLLNNHNACCYCGRLDTMEIANRAVYHITAFEGTERCRSDKRRDSSTKGLLSY